MTEREEYEILKGRSEREELATLQARAGGGDTMPTEPSSMSASDVMGGAVSNFGRSARQYGADIYTAVSDPINTA